MVRFALMTFICATFWCGLPVVAQENNDEVQTLQLNPEQPEAETQPASSDNSDTSDTEQQTSSSSEQQEKKITITAPTSHQSIFKQDIEKFIKKDAIQPVLAGTEDVMTLMQDDLHATDKGVVILLPEWQQAAISPKAINFLRKHLPKEGWASIVLQPLNKPESYPSRAEKETARKTDNEEALNTYREALIPQMKAVLDKAAEYPGIFVVIAEGNNAANLLNIYEQQQLPLPHAFIMLSAHMMTESDNIDFATLVAESELPILDLYLKKDVKWVDHFIMMRKQYADRELKADYRQRQLHNFSPSYYPEQPLARAIKGWLTSIGW